MGGLFNRHESHSWEDLCVAVTEKQKMITESRHQYIVISALLVPALRHGPSHCIQIHTILALVSWIKACAPKLNDSLHSLGTL